MYYPPLVDGEDSRFQREFGGQRDFDQPKEIGRQIDHEHLWAVVIRLPADYEPYGFRSRDDGGQETWHPDCSTGCRWYLPLHGKFQYDWGVCTNPRSHRCGLLTFEHQGCPEFEPEDEPASGAVGD
ncbi:MAG: hypothetical protein HY332_10755 [Chloroflexi bacterium]|nr:hypothetical protein [Chloroflexota bacterium]